MEDSAIDYGPLSALLGQWRGDKGVDVAPEPDGDEASEYFETIVFEPAGTVENAERQTLCVVRYHQVVSRKSNGEVFHDQVGYWTWDAATGVVAQSLTIPRAVCVLAGGSCPSAESSIHKTRLSVAASLGDADWGVLQSPFMRDNAKTLAYEHELEVDGQRLKYAETTTVSIYGRTVNHTDSNELVRG